MKRLLSFLLILSMLLSLFSVSAFADEKSDKVFIVLGPDNFTELGNWVVQKDHTTEYKILMGATNSVPSPDTPATAKICFPKEGEYRM